MLSIYIWQSVQPMHVYGTVVLLLLLEFSFYIHKGAIENIITLRHLYLVYIWTNPTSTDLFKLCKS